MQRIIILIYVIITATIAIFCTILEIQPALLIINIFAPNVGDSYSINIVVLLLWLILLSPLLIFLTISKLIRKKEDKNISIERTGIFITRKKVFQSAMVGIPIFINDKKAGIIDNGKTIKIYSFVEEQGKIKAEYFVNNTIYSIDIDGLEPVVGQSPIAKALTKEDIEYIKHLSVNTGKIVKTEFTGEVFNKLKRLGVINETLDY